MCWGSWHGPHLTDIAVRDIVHGLLTVRAGPFSVGRENVIAGTDCGLGGRIHPSPAGAKLQALAEGAELASGQLWGESSTA
jgi:methionine synthase II (cobalamin-independent)